MSSASAIKNQGRVGLPAPVRELASRRWDAIVVGAGHNGLTCAAYLARAGKSVLVLESRDRIGGACTLAEPWPGVKMSPCAYLAGLLHPLIIEELQLVDRGLQWTPAANGLFVPFEDGSSVQLHDDDLLCEEEIARLSPDDVPGWRAMSKLMARVRDAIRPPDRNDMWIGEPPTRDEVAERVGRDRDALGLLFEWSMADFVERYLTDERLQIALLGQGVIGTNASPFDPGTAYIRFHHSCGRMFGTTGTWGYVKGGMGTISFLLCDAAREAGAIVAAGVPVSRIVPGEGVILECGQRIRSGVVVSNSDGRTTVRLLDKAADPRWRAQVESIPTEGCTLKVNVWLRELPNFSARPGTLQPHHFGQINTPLTKHEWRTGYETARSGRLPGRLWTELYFQSVHDADVAPTGTHTMSMFTQYVPYQFQEGTWADHREAAKAVALESLGRFCTNIPRDVIDAEALGPPDIEERVGLSGGHIFQGECLPQFMWSNRLRARTPMPGVYLCGAATHPGGSVIAINGRNAAMAILGKGA
ncbi:MAG: NAD(P)/FAD-dependent oxidoreductase [Acidobacteriaceae bacterium]|nr:NAD(P)/FAD-dependent oxidoreductase [Acidobacteriaceae bacterium]